MKTRYYSPQNIEKLLAVIKRNKEKNLSNSKQEYDGLFSGGSDSCDTERYDGDHEGEESGIGPNDVKLVLFGAESPFLTSISDMLSALVVITGFSDQENIIRFVLEYGIKHVIVDLDSPTDCFESINIFSALKTLVPDVSVYACTKTPLSDEAQGLKHKDAVILPKPLFRKQIEEFVKKYL